MTADVPRKDHRTPIFVAGNVTAGIALLTSLKKKRQLKIRISTALISFAFNLQESTVDLTPIQKMRAVKKEKAVKEKYLQPPRYDVFFK